MDEGGARIRRRVRVRQRSRPGLGSVFAAPTAAELEPGDEEEEEEGGLKETVVGSRREKTVEVEVEVEPAQVQSPRLPNPLSALSNGPLWGRGYKRRPPAARGP